MHCDGGRRCRYECEGIDPNTHTNNDTNQRHQQVVDDDEAPVAADSFRPKLVGSLMMTGTHNVLYTCVYTCVCVVGGRHYHIHSFIHPSNIHPPHTHTPTGARVRLISAGGAHSAAVVDPPTGEEKGREEEEGLKAMYGASPTLDPGICCGVLTVLGVGVMECMLVC